MKARRTDLETALAATRQENTLLAIALQCVVNGEPVAVERCAIPDEKIKYVLRLVRATGAHGGIVIETIAWTDVEQRPSTSVHYLDTYRKSLAHRDGIWPLLNAVDRLVAARQRAFDAETKKEGK